MTPPSPLRHLQALVFDFDGTLAELNLDFDHMRVQVEDLARSRGYQGPWPRGYLLEAVDQVGRRLGPGFVSRARALIRELEVAAAQRARLFPFTLPLLQATRRRGLAVAIVSRNCKAAIEEVFPRVADQGRVFLPREAVAEPKPHPRHLLAACRALGVEPGRTALVGDHPLDVHTALAAGCRAIAVASGRIPAPELERAGAHLVLPDASALLEWL